MSQTIHASASELSARTAYASVRLVKITTYTDRAAGTGAVSWYFADRNVLYDYGNSGTVRNFTPFLATVGPEIYGISHIPDSDGGSASESGIKRTQTVVLKNAPFDGGAYLSEQFTNLLFADIEIAEVLRDDRNGESLWDLRDLAGDEHRVIFRGYINQIVGIFDSEIQLSCVSKQPTLELTYATGSTVAPADRGKPLNIVYGRAKKVKGITTGSPVTDTLAVALTTATATITLTKDATLWPSSGRAKIELEEIAWTGKSGYTLTGVTRGYNATTATPHSIGSTVRQVLTSSGLEVRFADREVSAIGNVYVAAANGELVRVTTGYDTNLLTAAITFNTAQQIALYDEIGLSAKVTQQPGVNGYTEVLRPSKAVKSISSTSYSYAKCEALSGAGDPLGLKNTATSNKTTWRVYFPTGQGLDSTREVVRWRLKLSGDHNGASTTGGCQVSFTSGGISDRPTSIGLQTFTTLEYGYLYYGSWVYPAAGTVASDMEGNGTTTGVWIDFEFRGVTNQPLNDWATLDGDYGVEVEFSSALESDTVVDAAGAGTKDLEFYADVDGSVAPFEFETRYEFNTGETWNVHNGGTHTDNTTSQKFTAVAATQWDSCDATTGWTGTNTTRTLDTANKNEGTGCLKSVSTSTSVASLSKTFGGSPEDWSEKVLVLDIFVVDAASLSATDGVRVYRGSSTSNNTSAVEFYLGSDSLIVGEWNTVVLGDYVGAIEGIDQVHGTYDSSQTKQFRVEHNLVNAASGRTIYIDNVRLVPVLQVMYAEALAGTNDLTENAAGKRYRLRAKSTNASSLHAAELRFAASGTGWSPGANRRDLMIPVGSLVDGSWVELDIEAVDTGTPSLTDCNYMALHLGVKGTSAPAIELDWLAVADDDLNQYPATAMGDVIEAPTDVVRHFIADVCGEGHSAIDTVTEAAAATNLGANVLAGGIVPVGVTFAQILEMIAFNARMNIIRSEEVSGTKWKMLTANANYTFDAAAGAITQWAPGAMVVQSKSEDQVITRGIGFWGWDASRGTDIEAFSGVVACSVNQNDITALVPTADLTAAEAMFGVKPAREFLFYLVQDEDTAKDLVGYYMHEFLRNARTVTIPDTKSWETHNIEPGDIRTVTPAHASSAMKVRIVQRSDRDLIAVEVE